MKKNNDHVQYQFTGQRQEPKTKKMFLPISHLSLYAYFSCFFFFNSKRTIIKLSNITFFLIHILSRVPEFSRAHPIVPKLYTPAWKTDMANREIITQVRRAFFVLRISSSAWAQTVSVCVCVCATMRWDSSAFSFVAV